MSAHLQFFAALDRLQRLDTHVMSGVLGRCRPEFLRRRWITESGHLTHVMVPFLDSQQEVEVEVDQDVAVYRYHSPQQRGRMVTGPLTEIALYMLQVDTWLDDLVTLIGIEDRRRSTGRVRVPDHLWHLGDVRVAGTHHFAPVFVARAWKRAPESEVTTALVDAIWPRSGVVLGLQPPSTATLPRDHAMRSLHEFVRVDESKEVFDASAFDRVLRGYVTPTGAPEPEQFLRGTRFKLPHFSASRELSAERAKIIKQMWGVEGEVAPEMSWAEVNRIASTGYQSFDDAFGGKAEREDVIDLVKRGKYRVRRNP
ncbi:hypothetical protein [uncultured Ralstonia sp.]|jgi:hypothetical protein|uniref:hypothetical protein n=1 Tax=Ralstonia sp. TaxID=54061 RepID=UPI0025F845F9|nr:hypothetical protein [uncultured Ralstonia sp.]